MNHKVHRFKTPDYRDSRLQTTRIQTQKLLKSNSWHEEGITRVIVTICILNVRIAMCRILPCLRQQTVVPVYVVPAEKKLSTTMNLFSWWGKQSQCTIICNRTTISASGYDAIIMFLESSGFDLSLTQWASCKCNESKGWVVGKKQGQKQVGCCKKTINSNFISLPHAGASFFQFFPNDSAKKYRVQLMVVFPPLLWGQKIG